MQSEPNNETEKPPKLSEELSRLQGHFAAQELSIGEIIVHLKGRAYLLLIILLSLPFLTPVPLPGLSTPFGAVIALIALRISLGQKPWLPRRLQEKRVPQGLFLKVLAITTRIVSWLERFLRPRWSFFATGSLLKCSHALLIFVSAVVLMLPLPIPFTNSFPAWVILLAAGGLLEEDGLSLVLAYVMFALGCLYFVFLGEAASHLVQQLWTWLHSARA